MELLCAGDVGIVQPKYQNCAKTHYAQAYQHQKLSAHGAVVVLFLSFMLCRLAVLADMGAAGRPGVVYIHC